MIELPHIVLTDSLTVVNRSFTYELFVEFCNYSRLIISTYGIVMTRYSRDIR